MIDKKYFNQAKLMIGLLPYIAKESCFALKGGTAINLFVRDMPRLSVDIDLAYLPLEDREESLNNIGQALDRISQSVPANYNVKLDKTGETFGAASGITYTSKLFIAAEGGMVKIEPNTVFRGCAFLEERRTLVKIA